MLEIQLRPYQGGNFLDSLIFFNYSMVKATNLINNNMKLKNPNTTQKNRRKKKLFKKKKKKSSINPNKKLIKYLIKIKKDGVKKLLINI